MEKKTGVPKKLVQYMLSHYDFYKVVSLDQQKKTIIQPYNMFGTLNQKSRAQLPKILLAKTKLPHNLLYIGMKPRSNNTVLMVFDNGWQFSFRIHNAEKQATPSLKFDVQLVGSPQVGVDGIECKWRTK